MTSSDLESTNGDTGNSMSEVSKPEKLRRTYSPPRIISAERLEATAASCAPDSAPTGKDPESCAAPGS